MTKIKGTQSMDLSDETDTDFPITDGADHEKNNSAMSLPQLKPQMDSIFAEVEKSLPSIDFDLSDVSSDNEEPIFFHGSLKTSEQSYDDDKDLDTSLSGESITEMAQSIVQSELSTPYDNDLALLKPIALNEIQSNAPHTWGGLISDYKNDNDVPKPQTQNWMSDDEDANFEPQIRFSSGLALMESELENSSSLLDEVLDNRFVQHVRNQNEDMTENTVLTEEGVTNFGGDEKKYKRKEEAGKRRGLDRDIASMFVSPRAPVLSLQAFENIDLDVVLESLNEDNQYGPQILSHRNRGDGDTEENKESPSEDMTLIQKLAQLSVSQGASCLEEIDPRTGAPKPEDNKDVENREQLLKESKKTTSCMGTSTSTNDLPKLSPPTLTSVSSQPKPEPETVFIDLRNFEKHRQEEQHSIERVQKILGISHESSDSSDSEDDVEQWQNQRRKIKQTLVSRGVKTDPLPSKPKPFDKTTVKQPTRVINLKDCKPKAQTSPAGDAKDEVKDDANKQKEIVAQREKARQMEVARKLREQREKERESRIRMGKRIEAVRPLASVSGRHPCAENTPVIFDHEASYEPPPKTLPEVISPDTECLLLTVTLSHNSEIVLHRNKTNKSVDTGSGLSASYTTLLTWLLSLVPDDFSHLQGADKQDKMDAMFCPPFDVIGLQQMWMDEKFSLVVAITPSKEFNAKFVSVKSKKAKVRDEVKGSTAFMQHVNKFLSKNTLHTVCPWLQAFVSMDVTAADQESSHFVYQPPLPNITTKPLSTFLHLNPDPKAADKVLNTPVGFYWQTVDSDDGFYDIPLNNGDVNYETQNTMSLIYKKIFRDPTALMGILNRVLQEGLDLSGVRLLYPTAELLNLKDSEKQSDLDILNNIGPVLAIALRGTFARSIWLDAVGPSDPTLARRTDPMSLCAQYGGSSRDECLLFCPRNPSRVHSELCRWFGGRVPPGGVIDVGTPYTRKDHLRSGSPKGRKGKREDISEDNEEIVSHRPPATLSATQRSDIILVLSPLVPPQSYGLVMATFQRRGYQIHGVKRLRMNTKRANLLGISAEELDSFCPGISGFEVVDTGKRQHDALAPSTVFILQKENSSHNAASLIEAFMIQMTLQGILGQVQTRLDVKLTSNHLFHAATYGDGLHAMLGGDFSKCPDFDLQTTPGYLQPRLYTNPEVEQIAVLILFGHNILKSCGLLLGKILNLVPHSKTPVLPLSEGFELLGLKWLPSLTMSQAREVTPFEVGDRQWRESIQTLSSEPVVILALRGMNAFKKLNAIVPVTPAGHSPRGQRSIDKMMSLTADEAYQFIRLFFYRSELFSDPTCRPLLPYLPESRFHPQNAPELSDSKRKLHPSTLPKENIFDMMLSGPQIITTFLLIKPSAVTKHMSKIFKKIAQECFQIVGFRMVLLTGDEAKLLLPEDVKQDTATCKQHIDHMTSGPSICLSLMRENAVKRLVDIIGPGDPQSARRRSQFLWRGTFGSDPIANGLYCSADYNKAMEDLSLFFPDGLCCEETQDLAMEGIACPSTDSAIDLHHFDSRVVNITHHAHDNSTSELAEVHEMLLQTSCLVLTSPLILGAGRERRSFAYVDVIDALLSYGFEMCGARLVSFTQNQAEHFLHLVDAGSFKQVPLLMSGPSLVLALQRDNAVLAFDSALGGSLSSDSLLRKLGHHIYRPSNIKQSHQMLTFFFDTLMPGSQITIKKKNEEQ